jgi:hypothetical protein
MGSSCRHRILNFFLINMGTVWMVGVNIYDPKENDLPLKFAPTNICPLGCLDGGVCGCG